MYTCLGVTCHLHFWQNDPGLLCATAITLKWNRCWNKSQHRKLTLGKKIFLPHLPDIKPSTFWPRVWHSVTELCPHQRLFMGKLLNCAQRKLSWFYVFFPVLMTLAHFQYHGRICSYILKMCLPVCFWVIWAVLHFVSRTCYLLHSQGTAWRSTTRMTNLTREGFT